MDSTELLFKAKAQDLARQANIERAAENEWESFTGVKAKGKYVSDHAVEFNFDIWRLTRRKKAYGSVWKFSRKCGVCGWWTLEKDLVSFVDLAVAYNNAKCYNTRKCKKAKWPKI